MSIPKHVLAFAVAAAAAAPASAQNRLQSSDFLKLRSVAAVQLSPDGRRIAYVVENNDGAGRPYGQLWVTATTDGKPVRIGGEKESSGDPVWSHDGQWIAYHGTVGGKSGLAVVRADGTGARFLAETSGTNAPLPGSTTTPTWSPDDK